MASLRTHLFSPHFLLALVFLFAVGVSVHSAPRFSAGPFSSHVFQGAKTVNGTTSRSTLAEPFDVGCPNGNNCPDGSTCCPIINGQIYLCCPLNGATCCANSTACCPGNSTCCLNTNVGYCCGPTDVCCQEGCCAQGTVCCGTACCDPTQTTCDAVNSVCVPICQQPCVNGQCTGFNTCSCSAGWSGPSCDIPTCSPACSLQASCVGPNTCSCDPGFGNFPNCDQVEPPILFGFIVTLQNLQYKTFVVYENGVLYANGTNPYDAPQQFQIILPENSTYDGPVTSATAVCLVSLSTNNLLTVNSDNSLSADGTDPTNPSSQFILTTGIVNYGNNYVLTSVASQGALGTADGYTLSATPSNAPSSQTSQWNVNILETSFLMDLVQEAAIAAINGDVTSALTLLNQTCQVQQQYSFWTGRKLTDPHMLTVSEAACTQANNLMNGLSVFGLGRNTIYPLEWTDYQSLVQDVIALLQNTDSWIQTYDEEQTTQQQKIALANQALTSDTTEEAYWQNKVQEDQQQLASYGAEIKRIREQANQEFDVVQGDWQGYQNEVTNQIQQLNEEIQEIQSEEDAERVLGFFSDIVKVFIGAATLGEGDIGGAGDFLDGTLGLLGDSLDSAKENSQIQQLESEIDQLEQTLEFASKMIQMANTLNQLDQYIFNPNETLPQILPALDTDMLASSELQNYISLFSQQLVSSGGITLADSVEDFISLVNMHINLVLSWYQTAMQLQNDQAQLQVYQIRASSVQQQLNEGATLANGVAQTRNLLLQKRSNQVYLFLLYFYEEMKQLEYLTLQNYSPGLPNNPSTSDLMNAQTNLEITVKDAIANRNTGPTQCYARISFDAQSNPTEFASLHANRTMDLSVVFPNVTNYYLTYFFNLHVYLFDSQSNAILVKDPTSSSTDEESSTSSSASSSSIIVLDLVHAGQSFFLDGQGNQWNFTHSPLSYPFYYNSSTLCPTSSPYDAPDFINYSPFGRWTLSVPNQPNLDITQIQQVTFEFDLYFYVHQGANTYPLFGRDNNWAANTCVAPLGRSCDK